MSLWEYLRAMGRPWGQLVGCSVLASSWSSQSILAVSSGMLILTAAWQAIEAAMRRYAERLEHYCRSAPYNWFNFYEFP